MPRPDEGRTSSGRSTYRPRVEVLRDEHDVDGAVAAEALGDRGHRGPDAARVRDLDRQFDAGAAVVRHAERRGDRRGEEVAVLHERVRDDRGRRVEDRVLPGSVALVVGVLHDWRFIPNPRPRGNLTFVEFFYA